MTNIFEPIEQIKDEYDPAPIAEIIRLRSYSRYLPEARRNETWDEMVDRVLYSPHLGLKKLGKFTQEEIELIDKEMRSRRGLGSSRAMWVQGTEWWTDPAHAPGTYNCSNFVVTSWETIGNLMDLAMQGCGTGAVVELENLSKLPAIKTPIDLEILGKPGDLPKEKRSEHAQVHRTGENVLLIVGDSRRGWVDAYQALFELSSNPRTKVDKLTITLDMRHVRPVGEKLKGFGGVSNPERLITTFQNAVALINNAVGRRLNAVEMCLAVDEGAAAVVAGGIRRSAGMKQGSSVDPVFADAKENLWKKNSAGKWSIDPQRDALRMSNHTRVFHTKPDQEECIKAVRKQFDSGEGAIQWAGEAVARSNADVLDTKEKKNKFLQLYNQNKSKAKSYLQELSGDTGKLLEHRMTRYGLNPCGEIIGREFFCNLSSVHLNQLDPFNPEDQGRAFKASSLQAAAYLQRGFDKEVYQFSRDVDPIVGVSFTGLFTFFVQAFGPDWISWWQSGRNLSWGEQGVRVHPELFWLHDLGHLKHTHFSTQGVYFWECERAFERYWNSIVQTTVWEYCDRHGLRRPNRYTTVKPEGSATNLTGVGANGCHVPKSGCVIRRVTVAKNSPVGLAAIDFGYKVVPSQDDKDENGVLLDDPFDPRCTNWLIEIPVKEKFVELYPELAEVNLKSFSALAQFDFWMNVQQCYTTHNSSVTLELCEDEIELLGTRIYQAIQHDEGYISAALLARFDAPFPRIPFEEITLEEYERLHAEVIKRRKSNSFEELFTKYLRAQEPLELGPQDSACEGFCESKINKDPNLVP